MKENDLSNGQFGAIKRSINLGRILQRDHPEIVDIYGYHPQAQIPEMIDIQSRYDVSDNVAVSGVRFAVTGHNGGFGVEAYDGLITDEEESEWIGREHMVQSGRKGGKIGGKIGGNIIYVKRIGVHGRTVEQMIEDGHKGGCRAYELRIGIHGRSADQMRDDSLKATIARGQTTWTDEEKEFLYQLSLNPDYQHHEDSRYSGKSDLKLITAELNNIFHKGNEVRNANSVQIQLFNYRRSLCDKVE